MNMKNINIEREKDDSYSVTWETETERFSMSLDKDLNPKVMCQKIIGKMHLASFSHSLIEHYHPGLAKVVANIVKEHNKLKEKEARKNAIKKKKVTEIRALLKESKKAEIKEIKNIENTSKSEDKPKVEQVTKPTTPIIVPELPKKKNITYIRLNFLKETNNNSIETQRNCDNCGALCSADKNENNENDTSYLCPLCFKKKERQKKG
ncbi:hypothetical protein [Bacillus sp. NPDC094106]|uniref:hypothetical protein n=1 Tax=Bacillus sp. NPDC094106 TaxID=3363949 RepID=UPI003815AAD2